MTPPIIAFGLVLALTACSATERKAGQVELYEFTENRLVDYGSRKPVPRRADLDGSFGDLIRYNDDVLAIQVQSVYLDHVPETLTGSRDVLLFAEVWENAAMGYGAQALSACVYYAENQLVPGRLNFTGNLAYGPTSYKGHPLKIRFTLMVLQKRTGGKAASSVGTVGSYLSAAASSTPYGGIASQAISMLREVLRSQPDVTAFDYEVTFAGFKAEGLKTILLAGNASPAGDVAGVLAKLKMSRPDLPALRAASAKLEAISATSGLAQAVRDYAESAQQSKDLAKARMRDQAIAMATADAMERNESALARGMFAVKAGLIDGWNTTMMVVNDAETAARLKNAMDIAVAIEKPEPQASENVVELAAVPVYPWLKYGCFALIETASMEMETVIVDGEQGVRRKKPFELWWHDDSYYRGGWIYSGIRERLASNYVVFTITPHLLEESADLLRSAAEANSALLVKLRQSQENVGKALAAVDANAAEVREQVIRRNIERIVAREARKIAQADASKFEELGARGLRNPCG